jgi:hypothetical protein
MEAFSQASRADIGGWWHDQAGSVGRLLLILLQRHLRLKLLPEMTLLGIYLQAYWIVRLVCYVTHFLPTARSRPTLSLKPLRALPLHTDQSR